MMLFLTLVPVSSYFISDQFLRAKHHRILHTINRMEYDRHPELECQSNTRRARNTVGELALKPGAAYVRQYVNCELGHD